MERIRVIQGDITRLEVDAIVNAANNKLEGGGGVDGAIHRIAGPELLKECQTLGGCPTGEAKMTKGYRLPARHVIHTVGPVWQDGNHDEAELLAACYKNSLKLAEQNNFSTVSFPAISCGVYGFPIDQAAEIAIRETITFLTQNSTMKRVVFVCFDDKVKRTMDAELNKHNGERS
jgi:O-acetyl-ADP-ribose deacetylase